MRGHKDVTNRSVSFTYNMQCHVDVSAQSTINGVLRAVFNIRIEQNIRWSSSCIGFRGFLYREKSSWQSEDISYLRFHLVKEFYWNTKVCLYKHKLSKRKGISFSYIRDLDGMSFLGIIWHVLFISEINQSHLGASWYVSAFSQFCRSLLGTSWYVL